MQYSVEGRASGIEGRVDARVACCTSKGSKLVEGGVVWGGRLVGQVCFFHSDTSVGERRCAEDAAQAMAGKAMAWRGCAKGEGLVRRVGKTVGCGLRV
jgi:hypothetical protein